jgi:hypothetical protein
MGKFTNLFLKIGSGYEVIEDYGLIDSASNVFGMGEYQEIRLLKCKLKNGSEAFLLEETRKGKFILGFDKQYFIISNEGLKKFQTIISKVLNN